MNCESVPYRVLWEPHQNTTMKILVARIEGQAPGFDPCPVLIENEPVIHIGGSDGGHRTFIGTLSGGLTTSVALFPGIAYQDWERRLYYNTHKESERVGGSELVAQMDAEWYVKFVKNLQHLECGVPMRFRDFDSQPAEYIPRSWSVECLRLHLPHPEQSSDMTELGALL